jgi:uncharacterized membrane protein YhaH (DUF805 family)
MGNFSIFSWLVALVFIVIYAIPLVKILNKAGYSGWWLLLTFLPIINFIMLYVFAFADWPRLRRVRESS